MFIWHVLTAFLHSSVFHMFYFKISQTAEKPTFHLHWHSSDVVPGNFPAWQWPLADHPVPWFARTHSEFLLSGGISTSSPFASEDSVFFDH